MSRRVAVALLLALVPALAAAQMGAAPPPRPATPGVLQEVGFDQHLGESVPLDLAFTDETGRSVRLADYFGKRPVVLSLVYYKCPMLCTISLNGLAGALEVLSFVPGQEFEVVTVSFDPSETPQLAAAKKSAYMARYKRPEAHAGWHFLTGPSESVAALTRAVGFRYVWDEATKQFAHPAGVLVLTPEGEDLPLPVRRRVRPQGPAAGTRRCGRGQDRQRRRPVAALLLPVRSADGQLQRLAS